jgi:hypothetical protein
MKWHHRLVDSDRALLLTWLAVPVGLVLVAFVLAVALTAFGTPTIGTLRSTAAGLSYVYLTIGLVWLPAYLAACAWLWWTTHDDDTREDLFKKLYALPLIAAALVWFPSLYFTPGPFGQKARMFPLLAVFAVVGGYLWVGLIRLIFRIWRRT